MIYRGMLGAIAICLPLLATSRESYTCAMDSEITARNVDSTWISTPQKKSNLIFSLKWDGDHLLQVGERTLRLFYVPSRKPSYVKCSTSQLYGHRTCISTDGSVLMFNKKKLVGGISQIEQAVFKDETYFGPPPSLRFFTCKLNEE